MLKQWHAPHHKTLVGRHVSKFISRLLLGIQAFRKTFTNKNKQTNKQMNKTLQTVSKSPAKLVIGSAVTALAATSAFAQDPGTMVTAQLGTVLGYATAIIPAGLLIWGITWGVRKAKSMGSAAS